MQQQQPPPPRPETKPRPLTASLALGLAGAFALIAAGIQLWPQDQTFALVVFGLAGIAASVALKD